jgi:hypothetical protein
MFTKEQRIDKERESHMVRNLFHHNINIAGLAFDYYFEYLTSPICHPDVMVHSIIAISLFR